MICIKLSLSKHSGNHQACSVAFTGASDTHVAGVAFEEYKVDLTSIKTQSCVNFRLRASKFNPALIVSLSLYFHFSCITEIQQTN